MQDRHKFYAFGISMVLAWTFPSTLVGLIMAFLLYTHPYSSWAFMYLDVCINSINVPDNSQQPILTTFNKDTNWNSYFCAHTTKQGKRCRLKPHENGMCKRHKNMETKINIIE